MWYAKEPRTRPRPRYNTDCIEFEIENSNLEFLFK
jgi:hypothetical protein